VHRSEADQEVHPREAIGGDQERVVRQQQAIPP